jgi:hypothetical protein
LLVFYLSTPGPPRKKKTASQKRKIGEQGMATKVNAFLVTACLLFPVNATAITGNEWRQLSQTAQQYYIIGILDGWDNFGTITLLAEQQSPVGIGFTKQIVTKHIECTIGMTYPQINVIIQKYIKNNPAQWHYSMALLVWPALAEVCTAATK